jgi:hypothetical protein
LIDITANTGNRTHAQTAAEHTRFTQDLSVPKNWLAGLTPIRALRHLGGAVFGPARILDRVDAMRNASEVTRTAMKQRFHEHQFFGRHAFFVGGRYVQVRFDIIEPRTFADPNDNSKDRNARINAASATISQQGLKLAMYYTVIPEWDPEMAEVEGWDGAMLQLAVIDVPPQMPGPDSRAARWFDDFPHVPAGRDKVFHAVGLGRHRVPIYKESGRVRNGPRQGGAPAYD